MEAGRALSSANVRLSTNISSSTCNVFPFTCVAFAILTRTERCADKSANVLVSHTSDSLLRMLARICMAVNVLDQIDRFTRYLYAHTVAPCVSIHCLGALRPLSYFTTACHRLSERL